MEQFKIIESDKKKYVMVPMEIIQDLNILQITYPTHVGEPSSNCNKEEILGELIYEYLEEQKIKGTI